MTRNELLDLARRAAGVTLVGNGRKLTDEQVYQMMRAAYLRGLSAASNGYERLSAADAYRALTDFSPRKA